MSVPPHNLDSPRENGELLSKDVLHNKMIKMIQKVHGTLAQGPRDKEVLSTSNVL